MSFEVLQWLILAAIVLVVLRFLRSQDRESGFKSTGNRSKPTPKRVANADPDSKQKARLLLQGVVLTGLPHQILGVREDASEFEIRKAHRSLIKRFHPDKVGPEGSRVWYEAQRASLAINGARDEMLARLAQVARNSNSGGE